MKRFQIFIKTKVFGKIGVFLQPRYFPKGTDFSKVPWIEIKRVVDKINHRPRKCLGYQSPHEVFLKVSGVALGN